MTSDLKSGAEIGEASESLNGVPAVGRRRSPSGCGCRTSCPAGRLACGSSPPGWRRPGSTGCSSATTSRSRAVSGFDGLVNATAVAVASRRLVVQTAVYLLPLRHPVPVARQVATLAGLAPGRLVFGVGLGGEDPAELRACGVDPASRGRRMDEALAVLRPLLAGAEVTVRGDFFSLDRVRIAPAPEPPVPVVIGGRSDAALRRVAAFGDGWLGLWVSPARYADAVGLIAKYAADAGRRSRVAARHARVVRDRAPRPRPRGPGWRR